MTMGIVRTQDQRALLPVEDLVTAHTLDFGVRERQVLSVKVSPSKVYLQTGSFFTKLSIHAPS